MTKYSQAFKQQVVDFYFAHQQRRNFTAKHFKIPSVHATRWVKRFQAHGQDGLIVRHSKRNHSLEFKKHVIYTMLSEQLSQEMTALRFNLYSSHISQWLKMFTSNRGRTFAFTYFAIGSGECRTKKVSGISLERKQAKAQIVHELRHQFPLKLLLSIVKLSRSTYFYHCQKTTSASEKQLTQTVVDIFEQEEGRYGYRRITARLRQTMVINHKKVQRIMQQLGLKGKCKRRKYRSYRGEFGKIAQNLLQRNFKVDRLYEKWVTDVTEFKCDQGKLYLSPIKDLFNGEIIAYDLSRHPNFDQTLRMLEQAIQCLPQQAQPILHSDQGWQYQMSAYQQRLKDAGIQQSMSRKGNCLDNSAMESFFARLKTECYFDVHFETYEQLEKVIHKYIHYYNHERIQVKLNGLSPVQYRNVSL